MKRIWRGELGRRIRSWERGKKWMFEIPKIYIVT